MAGVAYLNYTMGLHTGLHTGYTLDTHWEISESVIHSLTMHFATVRGAFYLLLFDIEISLLVRTSLKSFSTGKELGSPTLHMNRLLKRKTLVEMASASELTEKHCASWAL